MLLKYTDKKVINNPLNPIIDSVSKLLNELAIFDNIKNYKIIKYYTEDTIKITYTIPTDNYRTLNLVELKFFIYCTDYYNNTEEKYSLIENGILHGMSYKTIYDNRSFLQDELINITKKYVSKKDYLYAGGINQFAKKDFNNIINDINKIIEKIKLKKNINNYNL